MDSSFGPLDAFAFLVFAILIAVAVIVVVMLGSCLDNSPGNGAILRRQR